MNQIKKVLIKSEFDVIFFPLITHFFILVLLSLI